ncbi:21474_t:CDS:2 [Gigaspora rosea]|nr:21474_t:CDS:2 [Gigaspora rosea]
MRFSKKYVLPYVASSTEGKCVSNISSSLAKEYVFIGTNFSKEEYITNVSGSLVGEYVLNIASFPVEEYVSNVTSSLVREYVSNITGEYVLTAASSSEYVSATVGFLEEEYVFDIASSLEKYISDIASSFEREYVSSMLKQKIIYFLLEKMNIQLYTLKKDLHHRKSVKILLMNGLKDMVFVYLRIKLLVRMVLLADELIYAIIVKSYEKTSEKDTNVMIEDMKFMTVCCKFGATAQRKFIEGKYPLQPIYSNNLHAII